MRVSISAPLALCTYTRNRSRHLPIRMKAARRLIHRRGFVLITTQIVNTALSALLHREGGYSRAAAVSTWRGAGWRTCR
jgi:hypothetical protein